MTGLTEKRAGVINLLRRMVQVKVGWKWYLLILLGIPAVFTLGIVALPGALASFRGFPPNFAVLYLTSFVLIFLVGGPLGEEPGWRGFALPRMQRRYGPLVASLLLGVLWTCWHLPHFLTRAQGGGPGMTWSSFFYNFSTFFVMVMAFTIIITWAVNNNKGSVFIAILLHASINTFGGVLPFFSSPLVNSNWPTLIGAVVPALLIVAVTRGRLGYRADQEWVLEAK
jgi:membrane protease YdiL (CAAX protease family)